MYDVLRIAGIENDSIVDGPGLRLSVFVQGCPFRCDGCHNPEAIPFDGGIEISITEIYNRITSNPLLSGVTFSGGEPFSQAMPLSKLADMIKSSGLELAAYSGYLYEELIKSSDTGVWQLLKRLDILVDGPFIESQKHFDIGFRGSKNQRFINVQSSIKAGHVVLDTTGRWVT